MTNGRKGWRARPIVGAKRALKPPQVRAIRFWPDHEGRLRDRSRFDLAIDSTLPVCDLVDGLWSVETSGRARASL
ncbi:hypothetical protein ASG43_14670 [Aureimonas sp. Leaf454]|nr:hypothetical protein [Aureimonas sp. Leaf454]KQT44563.1 hypothetical protein ASG43_14670 [Aureimonas sp. Leaf454]